MLRDILIGRKYLADKRDIEQYGTEAEIAAFGRVRKPNWKVALQFVGNAVLGLLTLAMIGFVFMAVCACTDYHWVPLH